MTLDRTFIAELKKVNGDGSREAKFKFLRRAQEATRKLSTTRVLDIFDDVLKKYGRATVGICVAATILDRADRVDTKTVHWAREVMKLWTNKTPSNADSVVIHDGLHPCKIEWYAGSLIRCTTKEP